MIGGRVALGVLVGRGVRVGFGVKVRVGVELTVGVALGDVGDGCISVGGFGGMKDVAVDAGARISNTGKNASA